MKDATPGTRLYQGWTVLIGAFIAYMFASIAHVAFGLFSVPAAKELHVSRADANNWLIVMGIASAIIAPFAGRVIDRLSIRVTIAIGGVIVATTMLLLTRSSSLLFITLLAVPMAFASDAAGGMANNAAVARWFRRRRGRVLAILAIAASAVGPVLSPGIAWLITHHGWRTALMILGLVAGGAMILMAILLIRTHPTAEQLYASGELDAGAAEREATVEQRRWTYRELLTNRNFLLLAPGIGLLFASDRALLISIAPYLADSGISLQKAGNLIAVLMGSSIVGKLIVGYIVDMVDPRKIFMVVAALHIVLLALFRLQPSYWVLFSAVMVVGIGVGGVLPIYQVLATSIFGSASYGTVVGTATMINQVLMMSALRLVGVVRDRTGSYDHAFEIFAALVLLSAFLIWQLRFTPRPPVRRGIPVGRGAVPNPG